MDLKKNYDRALLVAGSILAIGAGGWWASQAMSFGSRFEHPEPTQGTKLDALSADSISTAITSLQKEVRWDRPELSGHKKTPLFVSNPFVVKKDKTDTPIDMLSDATEPLRPPIANWWLVENNLDYSTVGTAEADPDRDDFSNLDEFNEKTDPNSQLSRPQPITKLYYLGRGAEPLTLRLSSFDATSKLANVQVLTVDERGAEARKSEFKGIGATFFNDRFKILEHKQEEVERLGSRLRVDVIMVEDQKDKEGNPIRLEQSKPIERPTYYGNFLFGLTNETFKVKKGEDYDLKRPPIVIIVREISADHATVEYNPEGKLTPETKRLEKSAAPSK